MMDAASDVYKNEYEAYLRSDPDTDSKITSLGIDVADFWTDEDLSDDLGQMNRVKKLMFLEAYTETLSAIIKGNLEPLSAE